MEKNRSTANPTRQLDETEGSLVLKASGPGAAKHESLAHLCHRYRLPFYAYVGRRGLSHHDAEDLTQGFFEHFLEKGSLAAVDPTRGRFRNSGAVAIHRLNSRYRDLVRATVAETVANRGDAEAELNYLLASLAR